ncbi:MAG: hypothetical protein KME16_02340 [Scytolyngbya sp. HA4215-MV1]|nr:hypothetical protein [Scytolyngbya sp. HA4215-MV1]
MHSPKIDRSSFQSITNPPPGELLRTPPIVSGQVRAASRHPQSLKRVLPSKVSGSSRLSPRPRAIVCNPCKVSRSGDALVTVHPGDQNC